jgi:hypothetical protein
MPVKPIREAQIIFAALEHLSKTFSQNAAKKQETLAIAIQELTQKKKFFVRCKAYATVVTPFLSVAAPILSKNKFTVIKDEDKSKLVAAISQFATTMWFDPKQLDHEHQGKTIDLLSQRINRDTQGSDQSAASFNRLSQDLQNIDQKAHV